VGHIWQRRFYDFVVFTEKKTLGKGCATCIAIPFSGSLVLKPEIVVMEQLPTLRLWRPRPRCHWFVFRIGFGSRGTTSRLEVRAWFLGTGRQRVQGLIVGPIIQSAANREWSGGFRQCEPENGAPARATRTTLRSPRTPNIVNRAKAFEYTAP